MEARADRLWRGGGFLFVILRLPVTLLLPGVAYSTYWIEVLSSPKSSRC